MRFKINSFELTKEAKSALDEFAVKVKALDKGVYLEIQGHTDDTGGTDYNDQLGQQRAEAVRRYLARQHKLPLGRMSTISYGDTDPVETQQDGARPLQEPPRRDRGARVERRRESSSAIGAAFAAAGERTYGRAPAVKDVAAARREAVEVLDSRRPALDSFSGGGECRRR